MFLKTKAHRWMVFRLTRVGHFVPHAVVRPGRFRNKNMRQAKIVGHVAKQMKELRRTKVDEMVKRASRGEDLFP